MEATIKKQLSTSRYISRFWENLVKISKEKMTRAYLTSYLELLKLTGRSFLTLMMAF